MMGLNMPGRKGIGVVRQLRGAYPDAPLMTMTGSHGSEIQPRLEAAGVLSHLTNPFTGQDLLREVRFVAHILGLEESGEPIPCPEKPGKPSEPEEPDNPAESS